MKIDCHLKEILTVIIITLAAASAVSCRPVDVADVERCTIASETVSTLAGNLHGIAYDAATSSLYVGRNGKEILKRTGGGEFVPFALLADADGVYRHMGNQVFLFDLHLCSDGSLLGAAKKRLVRILPDASSIVLADNLMDGTYGVCGVTMDARNTIYFSVNGKGIMVLPPNGAPSLLYKTPGAVGVEISPDGRYLYVCENSRDELLVINAADGKLLRTIKLHLAAEYMHADNERLFVKGPTVDSWILFSISRNANPKPRVRFDVTGITRRVYGIQTSVIVPEGGDEYLYGTCWDSGEVYRVKLPPIFGSGKKNN